MFFLIEKAYIFANDFRLTGWSASPRWMRATAKNGVDLHTHQDSRKQSNNKAMSEELKKVADLITANTIFTTKEVLTTDEAAKYLGVSKSCLYKWTMSRAIPHFKSPTGKVCFFNRQEIEAWMQSCRVATNEELEQQAQRIAKKGGK